MSLHQLNRWTGALARVLFCTALLLLINPVWANPAHRVFLVVPELGQEADSKSVDEIVGRLKTERARYHVSPDVLPIVRFQAGQSRHLEMLRSLGVSQSGETRILLCRRGQDGWPAALTGLFQGPDAGRDAVREALGLPALAASPPSAPQTQQTEKSRAPNKPVQAKENPTEVGMLLAYRLGDEKEKQDVADFLAELGRYWTQRYGRVRPVPYPLGHYNLDDPDIASRVYTAFPQLAEARTPVVCLCLFYQGRPRKVLDLYQDLSLPATLVRSISADRTTHLASTVELQAESVESAPPSSEISLSDRVEESLLRTRVHETAKLLWAEAQDGNKGENRVTRRVLLQIADLTRPGQKLTVEQLERLQDALDDLESEPLLVPGDSELGRLQTQLLEAARTIWPARTDPQE